MTLPQGVYDGRALGWCRVFNLFWKGKVFHGATVTNRILGMELIQGKVYTWDPPADEGPLETVWIEYRCGVTDYLLLDGHGYRGRMKLGPLTVRFTLRKAT